MYRASILQRKDHILCRNSSSVPYKALEVSEVCPGLPDATQYVVPTQSIGERFHLQLTAQSIYNKNTHTSIQKGLCINLKKALEHIKDKGVKISNNDMSKVSSESVS